MRVCHVVRQYHPGVGGLETFVAKLAASLMDIGCSCQVMTLNRVFRHGEIRLATEESIGGVLVRRVDMLGHPRFFLPLFDDKSLAHYDVIHVHGIDGMFDRIARYKPRLGQVLVATSHGLFFHTPWMRPLKQIYLHTATRAAAARYDLLIANSTSDLERLREISDNVVRLPNGVSGLGSYEAGGRDILYLGRLARHKHVERLIAALAQPELDPVRLHVVGPEWDVTQLELARVASGFGVDDRVILHGHVNAERLASIAASCGLFASASSYEGFGMSLIEAMSVGLVPVVHSNPAFVELMDGAECGAVTDFTHAGLAARALRRQLDLLGAEPRERAIQYARRFSWQGHAAETLRLYRAAFERKALAA